MAHLFVVVIYQPFLNILVFFYWILDIITRGHPDMGIAVILLTIVIRAILLPISLMEDRGEKERRDLLKRNEELEKLYAADPIMLRSETKKLFRRNRGVVVGELFSLFIQVMIALMLWRIFAEGLTGQDIHLIYPFMPKVELPFNLVFLNKFDLTHTNIWLNFLQSFMIFVVETASVLTSPYPTTRGEVVRLQLILPVISFVIFMGLPAGKKLFVITTLIISLILILFKYVRRRFEEYKLEQEEKERLAAEAAATPQLLVETK
ncbi:YidC/Oxa1 family membrane protein insertase [Patescibacteria group bacterium]|nr:YidC/Oxa1 family membrane protein insertase [Patescibacteria group bacterium]